MLQFDHLINFKGQYKILIIKNNFKLGVYTVSNKWPIKRTQNDY